LGRVIRSGAYAWFLQSPADPGVVEGAGFRIVWLSGLALALETRIIKKVSDILSFRVNDVEAGTDTVDVVAFALNAFHPDGEKTLEM
jgi:hypothetical protein